jgi:hypothetical protein
MLTERTRVREGASRSSREFLLGLWIIIRVGGDKIAVVLLRSTISTIPAERETVLTGLLPVQPLWSQETLVQDRQARGERILETALNQALGEPKPSRVAHQAYDMYRDGNANSESLSERNGSGNEETIRHPASEWRNDV